MTISRLSAALLLSLSAWPAFSGPALYGQSSGPAKPAAVLDAPRLAQAAFGADAPWYLENIPFLEIDDPAIQRTYYYRWQVYRSHLREIGPEGTDETEFLPDVGWARHPYTDLNDSSSFHILEGRWLRNPAYVRALVDHLYAGGGNDRHFSESVAAATLAWTQVTGDAAPALRNLAAMEHVYNLWDDHFDSKRGLYWIEPLLDATEYTISSIDASGAGFTDIPSKDQNHNGFTSGYAFRPSINAYQYGNALAIAELAAMAGQPATAADFRARAARLQAATLAQLWNPVLAHFTDIYQRSTATVRAGDFIRGRELVGFVPWQFNMVPMDQAASPAYNSAWQHLLNPAELAGPFGLRTVEPSYPRYMHQYIYEPPGMLPECQWNGPAWPFQISQTLTGMANLLQDPHQHAVTRDQYLALLRQYTQMHRLADGGLDGRLEGLLDLQEDYNPDTGKPIVGLPRSHHYNHSTFNDLLLSGLLGIRPRGDDTLELNPLLPAPAASQHPIRFFALEHLRYHGRDLALLYDADGSRYHDGAGLSVFADGRRIFGPVPLGHALIPLSHVPGGSPERPQPGSLAADRGVDLPVDLAVNVWERAPSPYETELPIATASSTAPGSSPYQAIDGRLWFFPEVANGWSPDPAANDAAPWIAVDLRQTHTIRRLDLAFATDGLTLQPPAALRLQMEGPAGWQDVPGQKMASPAPVGNGITHLLFPALQAQKLRVMLQPRTGTQLRLIELEAYGDETAHP